MADQGLELGTGKFVRYHVPHLCDRARRWPAGRCRMLPVLAANLHRFLVEGTCDATSDVPTARRSGKTDDGDHATRADEPPHPSYALGRARLRRDRQWSARGRRQSNVAGSKSWVNTTPTTMYARRVDRRCDARAMPDRARWTLGWSQSIAVTLRPRSARSNASSPSPEPTSSAVDAPPGTASSARVVRCMFRFQRCPSRRHPEHDAPVRRRRYG